MQFSDTSLAHAHELDQADELAHFRVEFVIDDPDTIYMDGNSLGRLPKRSTASLHNAIEHQWGRRLIRSWNESWYGAPARIGARLASLVGARPDEVTVSDATSVNLFKLAMAALKARPGRTKIVSDVFNFPSDLYIFQGIVDLLGGVHSIELIPSEDGVTISPQAIQAAIDQDTALVSLSHVAFKSAFMYDMEWVTGLAHRTGALTLWDLSHSAGSVPVDLNAAGADLAVGCTYKYLNGGPGAPAFLYVRRDLQDTLIPPIWGWFASRSPFDFDLDFNPSSGLARYMVSTPPVLSLLGIEPALELLLEAGIPRLRAKSLDQTEYLVYLADRWLEPLGFTLGSPRRPEIRGSHISLRHPEGYRINRALIGSEPPAVRVIPDFRSPDNIRLGIAPLYTSFTDIHRALERMRQIVEEKRYESYPAERLEVT